jgi:hypothetical protein
MSTLIATGEVGCTFHEGAPYSTVSLSGTGASHCDTFAASGLASDGLVDVTVIVDSSNLAVYENATYTTGTVTLPTATKTIGTITDSATVSIYAVSLVRRPFDDLVTLGQLHALEY